ncbi:MAG: hypothetical protein ACJARP_003062, partial [Vicingaceae bacterium]
NYIKIKSVSILSLRRVYFNETFSDMRIEVTRRMKEPALHVLLQCRFSIP